MKKIVNIVCNSGTVVELPEQPVPAGTPSDEYIARRTATGANSLV